jgi:hypothetical protein
MGFFSKSPPSERQTAERNLAKGGVPESRPQPGYEGRFANYVVKNRYPSGQDKHGTGYVIPPGGKSYRQEMDELDEQADREDWEEI